MTRGWMVLNVLFEQSLSVLTSLNENSIFHVAILPYPFPSIGGHLFITALFREFTDILADTTHQTEPDMS